MPSSHALAPPLRSLAAPWQRLGSPSHTLTHPHTPWHPVPRPLQELLAEYNKAEVLEDYRCDGCGKKGVAEPKRSAALEEEEDDDDDEEEEEAPLLIRKQLWLCEVHHPHPVRPLAPSSHPPVPKRLWLCEVSHAYTMHTPGTYHAHTMHTPCICQVPHVFVLTLKRYSGGGRYSKISRHVAFERTVDLSHLVAPAELAAVPDEGTEGTEGTGGVEGSAPAPTPPVPPAAATACGGDQCAEAGEAREGEAARPEGGGGEEEEEELARLRAQRKQELQRQQHTEAAGGSSSGSAAGGSTAGGSAAVMAGCRYELCAVLVHQDMMNSCFFGHYIAFVRRGEAWWCLDDDEATECSWDHVAQQKACMLLYNTAANLTPQP